MAISGFPISTGGTGGGGSGVTNRYAGVWDLSIGNTVVAEAAPDPLRSTGFLKVTDDMFSFIGDSSPMPVGVSYMDGVMANGASTTNSGLRSAKALWPSVAPTDNFLGLMLGVTRNDINLQNVVDFLMTGTSPVQINGVLFLLQINPSTNDLMVQTYLIENSAPLGGGAAIFAPPSTGDVIFWGVDTDTGMPFISIAGDTRSPNMGFNLNYYVNDTFSPSYSVFWNNNPQLIVANPSTFVFDLGTTEGGRLPFLSESVTPVLPNDAADGKVYEIVGADGVYAGNQLNQGDFVEFANNLQKLIVTSKPKTTSQINQIIDDRVSELLTPTGDITTAINQAIEASKGKLLEEIEILYASSSQYYIDPDSDVVVLKGDNNVTGVIVYLPIAQYQYQGKRLIVISYIQSTDFGIAATGEYIYGNLPPIASIQAGDVFEFVAQPHPTNGNPVWARIK